MLQTTNENLFKKFLETILFTVGSNDKFYGHLLEFLNYRRTIANREEVYSLYSLRRGIGERTREQLEQFDNVLDSMRRCSSTEVMIHTIQFQSECFMFFTSSDLKEYFGYIVFPYIES
ncbi:hypothetical protein DVR12_17700 [Chitinophaga silvatica]|uniref:Uncharacterized protein n=1 Tax=Chitinophaga silvatica TaxID=2282649 RepID=A0A3E1Y8H0_9BACT|nr:hypothetical protein DVR12_17700 [Chitinophaga silvatica]